MTDSASNINHGRFKDAVWYNRSPLAVTVAGQGGTGSFISFFLSRILKDNDMLLLIDMDKYEPVNFAGQFVSNDQMGLNKVDAIRNLIANFSPGKYKVLVDSRELTNDSIITPISFSCFDNMKARKLMFEKWKNFINESTSEFKIFIDPRLEAESFQIYCVTPDRIEEYEATLVDDSTIPDLACTLKQTTHVASIIGGMCIGLLTNYISNITSGFDIRQLPFKTLFSINTFKLE